MDFVAIDFETANWDYASICQIGMAFVKNGIIVDTWGSYIDPEENFYTNTYLHGISGDTVKGYPTFPLIYDTLYEKIGAAPVISYGGFDIAAFKQVHQKYSLNKRELVWLNAQSMVRRQWVELAKSGYALDYVSNMLKVENNNHHDAINDATVCANIVNKILFDSNHDINWWIDRIKQSIKPIKQFAKIEKIDGNLYGETVLFTGSLVILRSDASELAANAGADVVDNFTSKVTMLVVGNNDIRNNNDNNMTSKYKKALEKIKAGINIKIVKEDDFFELVTYR